MLSKNLKPEEILKLTSKSQEDLIKNNVLCGGGVEKFLEFYDNHFELGKGGGTVEFIKVLIKEIIVLWQ
jgi:hypothetical protein